MPPKRAKSTIGSAGLQRWEQALLSTSFYDEGKWNATIAFVLGNQVEDFSHIETLAGVVNSGIRKLFTIITKDDLFAQVRELGNPKGKRGKETPSNFEVCEPCKDYLDKNEDIPLPLLARLLKFRLLDIKQKDIARRTAEKKAAADGGKGKGGKGDKKERGKSPAKGKGGKKTPEPPSAKEGSKLRRRGDEDNDSKYIDDEPDDGPEHYILVTGFPHAHLLGQLAEIGIYVDCIVKVTSENYDRFVVVPNPEDEPVEKDEKTLALEEEARVKKEADGAELCKFWKDNLLVLRAQPQSSKLHDVARLEYVVKDSVIPESLEEPEKKTEFGTALYEDVACLVYDMLDAKRQWRNYQDNLKLIHVPVFGQPSPPPQSNEVQSQPSGTTPVAPTAPLDEEIVTEVDMRFYSDMLNNVPQESVSVPLIMHCMLEQVCATEEEREPPSETPRPPRMDGLEDTLSAHISGLAFKLALSDTEQQLLSQDFDAPKRPPPVPTQPLLIQHQDDIMKRLHHLKTMDGFNPEKAELHMLSHFPLANIGELPTPDSKVSKERAARLQELIHFCATGGLTQAEVDRAFKQFVFESMGLTFVDGEGHIVDPAKQTVIPWDDPYPYFKDVPLEEEDTQEEQADAEGSKSPVQQEEEVSGEAEAEVKPEEQQSSTGILLKSGASSRRSSTHSVHFERDVSGVELPQPGDLQQALEGAGRMEASPQDLDEVIDAQQRSLYEFCFAEHFKPDVLQQVLNSAMYKLPYMDTYYHKRDHSLLVVLHNPFACQLKNQVEWNTSAHSNVGFRNYLEHVADSVSEWTRTEEAKYQATILAKEVEKIQKDADEASSRPTSGAKGKGRSKSPKKSPSRKNAGSRASSEERPSSANPFVRPNSLKAWKEEQDRIKAEEEEKERVKSAKRGRSPAKKGSKEDAKDDKGKPGSRSGSAKSRASNEKTEPGAGEATEQEPKEPEKYWPFTGYDLGNTLLHAKGKVTNLFPGDGGQIRTEVTQFTQGDLCVKATVMKDGHLMSVHVLEPKEGAVAEEQPAVEPPVVEKENSDATEQSENGEPKEEEEAPTKEPTPPKPCVGCFGSFAAQLSDGMSLAISTYGPNGVPENGKKYEPEEYTPPAPRSPSPMAKVESPTKGKGKDKDKAKENKTPEPPPVEEDAMPQEEEEEVAPPPQQFQELSLTCPDGLCVSYYLESAVGVVPVDESDRRILVKQSYPNKTRGRQPCEAARRPLMSEVSRVISCDGTVTKSMMDGTVQILKADGTYSECTSAPLVPAGTSRHSSPQRGGSARSQAEDHSPSRKPVKGGKGKKKIEEEEPEEDEGKKGRWVTTLPTGERVSTYLDGTKVEDDTKDALVSMATDPQSGQVMLTREDHVVIVTHPDNMTVVEHADGTRITSYVRQLEVPVGTNDQDETGESPKTEQKEVQFVHLECPGYATVKFENRCYECSTEFGNGTVLHAFPDGSYDLFHTEGGYMKLDADGSVMYHPKANADTGELQYTMRHFSDVIVETVDNTGNSFSVNNTGECNVVHHQRLVQDTGEDVSEEEQQDMFSRYIKNVISKKKVVTYQQHAPRFFIVHNDGSGTELLRYQDVADYIAMAEDDPATAILMDPLPDFPGVVGITVLRPYLENISDKWLKNYDKRTIIPPGLTSRDLKTLPAKEVKNLGPKFGTNVGQGLAVGSAGPAKIMPSLKCPKMLEMRQIIQYKPISEDLKDKLHSGLREYAEYVRRRAEESAELMVEEPRSESEIAAASELQSRLRVCTPLPERERTSVSPTPAVPIDDDVKGLYEKATAPKPASPPPTPQPKRTKADWERDMRERAMEIECRQALRDHDVPNYFQSDLGKAFLLSQAPDMGALARELAEDPRQDSSRAVRANYVPSPPAAPNPRRSPPRQELTPSANPMETPATDELTPGAATPITPVVGASGLTGQTPTSVRPGNPTPSHAQGQGSPTPLRPGNPTPQHAVKAEQDRPVAPTPKEACTHSMGGQSPCNGRGQPSIIHEMTEPSPMPELPNTDSDLVFTRSLEVDVVGQPRAAPVRLPAYLHGGRPNAIPNNNFTAVEDPVRRQIYNMPVVGGTAKGVATIKGMRGFELLPERLDFGTLREGHTYNFVVHLKNTGVDSCRYKLKQPPPSTGIKIVYKPGPVAAGMKVQLNVEIYAIAVGVQGDTGVGAVSHDLELVTETDRMFLPITATVMTAQAYDQREPGAPGKAPGVAFVTNKPPAGTGIIRPRRDQMPGP